MGQLAGLRGSSNLEFIGLKLLPDVVGCAAPWPDPKPFRYAQFCSLARAAEVLGHRWNLLILRELFHGPMRFRDLRDRLRDVSSSVLAERLRELEARGVIAAARAPAPGRRSPSTSSREDGRAFWPALAEITRWGARFLLRDGLRPGDHTEPDWLRGAATVFARSTPTPRPPHRVPRARHPARGSRARRGRARRHAPRRPRARGSRRCASRGTLAECLGVIAGFLDPAAPPAGSTLRAEGDLAAARAVPRLFEIDFGSTGSSPGPGAPPH